MSRSTVRWVLCTIVLLLLLACVCVWLTCPAGSAAPMAQGQPSRLEPSSERIARGEYLARLGNCRGCHTVQGGEPFAGGRGIETPFGTVYSPNLTSDPGTGMGRWTSDEFWRAMSEGKSRDGRLLYPAFPYPSYTYVTRDDSDAIFDYLQSLPAVERANLPHALRFPFSTQAALSVWRAAYFRPQAWQPRSDKPNEWNRGAYLVQGLGHCAACHAPRNAWGATVNADGLGGAMMPVQNWYAPSLAAPSEAGVSGWPQQDVITLLQTGVAPRASVSGPMAEVVFGSTQFLQDADAQAIAIYLQSLPMKEPEYHLSNSPMADSGRQGGELYARHCAQCHGDSGEGRAGQFPALAGNRAINLHNATNLVKIVLEGGYAPATAGNPQPHGMPPFSQSLSDDEIAAVLTYIRSAWANRAPPLTTIDVYRVRERRAP